MKSWKRSIQWSTCTIFLVLSVLLIVFAVSDTVRLEWGRQHVYKLPDAAVQSQSGVDMPRDSWQPRTDPLANSNITAENAELLPISVESNGAMPESELSHHDSTMESSKESVSRTDAAASSDSARSKVIGKGRTPRGLTCKENAIFSPRGKPCEPLQNLVRRQKFHLVEGPDVRYVFCVPPKNGCTYHAALMLRIRQNLLYKRPGEVHSSDYKRASDLSNKSPEEIEEVLKNETLPKYYVVRNPMQRTLSAYLNKVEGYLQEEDRTVETFHSWLYEQFPKGSGKERDWSVVNGHWRPQTKMCGFEKRGVANLFTAFRVEEPKGYVDFLYKIVPLKYLETGWGENGGMSFRAASISDRTRSGGTTNLFFRYFNSTKIFDHLARELEADITKFGYEDEVAQMRKQLIE